MSRKHLRHREVSVESSSLGLLHTEHILQAHHWWLLGCRTSAQATLFATKNATRCSSKKEMTVSVRTWMDWSSKVLYLYHHCIRLNQIGSKPTKIASWQHWWQLQSIWCNRSQHACLKHNWPERKLETHLIHPLFAQALAMSPSPDWTWRVERTTVNKQSDYVPTFLWPASL